MPAVSACPDQEMLQRLALGKLDPEVVEPLARHCEQCASCIELLHGLRAGDSLLAVLASHGDPRESKSARAISDLIARLKSNPPSGSALRPSKAPERVVKKQSTLQLSSMHTAASIAPDEAEEPAGSSALDFLAPPQAADEIGRLGHYRVLKVLGQGGMGVVFQAEDPKLGRMCALKVMLADIARNPAMKERFLREARAAAQVEHDHIVPIYQVDEDRGVPFIAMPFLKGSSLEDWIQQKQKSAAPITVANILKLAREMAKGLSVAHDRGLIHRDIKPANIWLDSTMGGRVKILDFGLARLSGSGANEKNLTQSGMIMGTPAYMAPEQAQGKKDAIDGRTDLFSLGCILYRLCTGDEPFHGEDMISTLVAVAMENPTPPSEVNPAIPQQLSDLVMRLLAKKPEERPHSASEVVKAVAQMEKALAAGTLKPAGDTPGAMKPATVQSVPSKPPRSKPPALSELPSITAPAPEIAPPQKRKKARAGKRRGGIPLLGIGLGAFGFIALIVAGVILFWETPHGVVRVQIDDPNIQAGIDKEELTIKGAGPHEISFRTGPHTLHVKRDNLEFETDKFILKKGDTVTLKVEYLDGGQVQVTQNGKRIGGAGVAKAGQGRGGPPPGLRTIPGWGEVLDPDGDCKIDGADTKVALQIPGKFHSIDGRGNRNSPRVLREVDGDFSVQVKVASSVRVDLSSGLKNGLYRAASLLVWGDEKIMIRLDREAQRGDGQSASFCRLKADLQSVSAFVIDGKERDYIDGVQDVATLLRIERRQGKFGASYSQDGGKQWVHMTPQPFAMPSMTGKVKVGVAAVNITSQPMAVEFEDFRVDPLEPLPSFD
ncbi:MAG TPA: protein kinase, partial [Gemmataceae bacterium]|nr:protein kinase [Gemmataceae bacterium]